MAIASGMMAARAQTAQKSEDRLEQDAGDDAATSIATPEQDASLRIRAPLAPTRLALVLAPHAVDPAETVFIDVYLQQAAAKTKTPETTSSTTTAELTQGSASQLAGTVAFTQAEEVGEEAYFVVNVPKGMRFENRAAIVTIALVGANAPLQNSAIELRRASLVE
ncbi:hypothetical protein [Jiella mangrovi]|uniref:Uncharacterized protein n=1 Tax=Jiella mangrovi TaxID=2821407 RepID=A0ABS4BFZ4_9HYPH|nr:hypothetical protein [Jiella mangrovi]MBP0614855.1 hypothetical protein [Jiella mangrovi]